MEQTPNTNAAPAHEALFTAFGKLTEADFTAAGTPRVETVNKLIGIDRTFTASEIAEAFAVFSKNNESATGDSTSKVKAIGFDKNNIDTRRSPADFRTRFIGTTVHVAFSDRTEKLKFETIDDLTIFGRNLADENQAAIVWVKVNEDNGYSKIYALVAGHQYGPGHSDWWSVFSKGRHMMLVDKACGQAVLLTFKQHHKALEFKGLKAYIRYCLENSIDPEVYGPNDEIKSKRPSDRFANRIPIGVLQEKVFPAKAKPKKEAAPAPSKEKKPEVDKFEIGRIAVNKHLKRQQREMRYLTQITELFPDLADIKFEQPVLLLDDSNGLELKACVKVLFDGTPVSLSLNSKTTGIIDHIKDTPEELTFFSMWLKANLEIYAGKLADGTAPKGPYTCPYNLMTQPNLKLNLVWAQDLEVDNETCEAVDDSDENSETNVTSATDGDESVDTVQ